MSLDYEAFFAAAFALEGGEVAAVMTNPKSVSPERHAMAVRWHLGLTALADRVGA